VRHDEEVQEIAVAELVRTSTDPFLLHQLDPASTLRAWVSGAATVVEAPSRRRGVDGTTTICLGPNDDLVPLMLDVAGAGVRPTSVGVEAAACTLLPPSWAIGERPPWFWMWTVTPCAPADHPLELLTDADEINALLDLAMPDSHTRPGGAQTWHGFHAEGRLVAAGGLLRTADGSGHLGGLSVHPAVRRRGWGRQLSLGLTQLAQQGASRTASLGVYAHNTPAIRLYEELGYRTAHTFTWGDVRPAAAAP